MFRESSHDKKNAKKVFIPFSSHISKQKNFENFIAIPAVVT